MLPAFSLSTASLAVIEPEASMTCRMVSSMRAMAALAAAGEVGGLLGHVVDLVHGFDQFLGSRGNLAWRWRRSRRWWRRFRWRCLLLLGGGGDLGGRGVDLDAGALHLADEDGEIIGQPVQTVGEHAKFIAPFQSRGVW